ncbi:hypothetical protein D7B24_006465 [Verticillium nonalfalfae]|uniref:Galactosyl transferase GMA12/MNN10 family protein n=1 Tax=Verticillium nonalfalfae TaxID=1051616 RepID=A0A3M9Y984_9PEZI|nr:uncharacterized protein D7B24_006465 [Verticillium nonalfalfae]RNJ57073.1 hypothetical protein D7B24_006465 [Verticillium nonalfalfae]
MRVQAFRRTFVLVFSIVFPLVVLLQVTWMYRESLPTISLRRQSLVETKLHCYGDDDCFPDIRSMNASDLNTNIKICQNQPEKRYGAQLRVATVTAQFGQPEDHYKRALRTHLQHSLVHQSEVHVLCAEIVDDLWNKPAFILELLLSEMEKPEDERLEWLFWVDRDTIILDNCRSASSFLPPAAKWPPSGDTQQADGVERPEINLVATKDWNGLNNGIFLLRVSRWSVDLFAAILALRYFRPGVELPFTEQSAMAMLMQEFQFAKQVAWVPQWWFNAYPRPEEDFDEANLELLEEHHARRGDFLVHFAGLGNRDEAMPVWLGVAEDESRQWSVGTPLRDVDSGIRQYWRGRVNAVRN